ncbi:MAG: HlyD family efflux transporter periplasmic adaptor subunit [Pseudomonadota bacterium]
MVGLFLVSLTLGLLTYAGASFYGALSASWNAEDRNRPPRERVFSVNVVTYEPCQVTPVLTSFGEVRSRRTFEVHATAPGIVTRLNSRFEEGGVIEAGQLMVQIDPTDAESALAVAKTDLSEAELEVSDATRALELAEIDLEAAIEQSDLRVQALNRQQSLNRQGIGTEAAEEAAALAASSARQFVISKEQELAAAKARLHQAENRLQRVTIEVAEADRALAETRVVAPFTGTLSGVTLVEGRLVQNNEKLADLVDPARLEVSFRVSTAEYARLLDQAGQLRAAPITVTLDVLGADLVAEGVITRESAQVGDGQTGRVIFAEISAPGGFRPGDFVTVEVTEEPLEQVATLPAAALGAGDNILVLGEEDRLEAVDVTLLRRQGDMVLVRASGLDGRLVVAEQSPLIGAGIKVRPITPVEAEAPPPPPDMVELAPDRRAKLVAFIEGNQFMPNDVKERVLTQLAQPMVPMRMVERIESRMGG